MTTSLSSDTVHSVVITSLQTLAAITYRVRSTIIDPFIITPLGSSLSDRFSAIGINSISLPSLLLLILIFLLSLRVLNYIRRVVMWWVTLIFRLALVLVLVQAGVYVARNGVGRTLEQLGWLWGLLEGFFEGDANNSAQASARRRAYGRSGGSKWTDGRPQVPLSGRGGRWKGGGRWS